MNGEKWQVLESERVMEHPFLQVDMETVSLPDGQVISDWPVVHARDYVNALVFDEKGRALILDGYKHGARRSGWQMVGGYIEEGEDPLMAVERELKEETGYESDEWRYLGSFVVDANRHVGVGHYFMALDARQTVEPDHDDLEAFTVRFVALKDLKYALMDGRVNVVSYAMNILLALLSLDKLGRNQVASSYLASMSSNGHH